MRFSLSMSPKGSQEVGANDFLYVRLTIIGTDWQLGVAKPTEALLDIIVRYLARMDTPAGGKRLLTSPGDILRSWTGEFGYAKVGASSGSSMRSAQEAFRQRSHQILCPYGSEGDCTEAGGSSFFIIWRRKDSRKELITAPLDDQLILNGVTRRSHLDLARERLKVELEAAEGKFTIDEIQEAAPENRLLESFAAGVPWFVTPIALIHRRGKVINIPTGPDGTPAEIARKLKRWLGDMIYGRV